MVKDGMDVVMKVMRSWAWSRSLHACLLMYLCAVIFVCLPGSVTGCFVLANMGNARRKKQQQKKVDFISTFRSIAPHLKEFVREIIDIQYHIALIYLE